MLSFCLLALAVSAVQITDVALIPDPLMVGQKAQLRCALTAPEAVESVTLVLLDSGMEMPLTPQGDGVYELSTQLPAAAPTGEFPAKLIARLMSGGEVEHLLTLTITEAESQPAGTLKPTFDLRELEDTPVPYQNGAVFPSLERQSTRPVLELSGLWYSKRVPEADHDLTLTNRTLPVLREIKQEAREAFRPEGFNPLRAGWQLARVPGPNNLPPDRYQGCVWYCTEFEVPDTWTDGQGRLIFLAANYVADVWLDGVWIGYHEGGYTPFVFDVSRVVQVGERHQLVVRVDNVPWIPRSDPEDGAWQNHRDIVPYATADWWNYGGILRDVYLEWTPVTHVLRLDALGDYQDGVCRLAGQVLVARSEHDGVVRLTLHPAKPDSLIDPFMDRCAADTVLAETEVTMNRARPGLAMAAFDMVVDSGQPWTPESPQLYYLRAQLADGETFTTQVGFRSISTRGDQLLWNGESYFVKGVSRHEDYPSIGRGVTYAEMPLVRNDLQLMKQMNANFLRLGHYPNHPMTALLTDRLGLIAWEEIPVYWFSATGFRNQQTRRIARQMWLEMIYTDYNRPSIGFWSTCNECSTQDERRKHMRELRELAQQVDGSRLIVQSAVGSSVDPSHVETDVIGMTLYHGVFYGDDAYQDTLTLLDKTHAQFPDKPIVCSEFGYWSGESWGNTEKQGRIVDDTLRALSERDFVWGATWWLGFDYSTFHTGINTMGAVSYDRHRQRPVYRTLQDWFEALPREP